MAPQQGEVDILFDVKNSYYIGNYQQAITEAQKLKPPSSEIQLERDIYLYRSYISQRKYRVVLDEINGASPAELRPLKTLADYFSNKNKRDAIVSAIDDQLNDSNNLSNHTFVIVAATIYCHEKNNESALRVLYNDDHIESLSMNLQCYLRMDRVDLAKKELKVMQEKDEDNTLTQLAQAWLNIAMGGDKLQDAYYIFQELMDKYGSSVVLLNGQAVTFIGQGKYEEAEAALTEAMDKDNNNPDTLLNMMVLSQHLGKPLEVTNRYRSQLFDSHGDHHFVTEYNNKEKEFERLAQQYSITV
ncbi:coatomer subunit epsilon [Halyomorpha halys]|uniref:coatomer subunit epsilon n=1 Tax=Halyomorpha halys TaxID=286706 RepID=UPI0006D52581|nr:coatomer subunit epsilon [Halyomorpha halys]